MKKTLTTLLLYLFIGVILAQTDSTGLVLKVFLQGATSGNIMHTLLNQDTLLPMQQPYDIAPWNYNGGENLVVLPANMVDWVMIELRSRPDTIIDRRAGILLSNGNIVDTNGGTLKFINYTNSFYIVVFHRNHLPVMTASPVMYSDSIYYDFTDTPNFPIYGNDVINLGNGIAGMIVGDVNVNMQLKYSGPNNDRAPILQKIVSETGSTSITTTINGYYTNEDVNMNGTVKYSGPGNDPSKIIQNLVNLTGSNALTSVYNSHVPDGFVKKSCGDMLIDSRDGQQYPTVLIGIQCWMAKNLNTGTFVESVNNGIEHSDVSDNGVIEKYCHDNDTNYCNIYGGLYDWNEMMGYLTTPGINGICPSGGGWRIPTDNEWKILEGTIDSQYGIGNVVWNNTGFRGYDAGNNIKETGTTHWYSPNTGATNSSDFTALPGGIRNGYGGHFHGRNMYGYFWSSSFYSSTRAWLRDLRFNNQTVQRENYIRTHGFSVRCVRDSSACTLRPDQSNAGEDQNNILLDSVTLQANSPVYGLGVWSIISGNGGIIQDTMNPSSVFFGMPDSTYALAWTISTHCGSTSDTVIISFAPVPFNCGDTLIDSRDGQKYPTVLIGSQCWMAKNLNVGIYTFSTYGPNIHTNVSNNGIIEKYCYSNDTNNCNAYGGLYDWNEMMGYDTTAGVQGICPPTGGWHIPTDQEWNQLEGSVDSYYGVGDPVWNNTNFRGYDAGGKLKSTGTTLWTNPNAGATNTSGFTGMPSGARYHDGGFFAKNLYGYFWTSTLSNSTDAWRRTLVYYDAYSYRDDSHRFYGMPVRCLKN